MTGRHLKVSRCQDRPGTSKLLVMDAENLLAKVADNLSVRRAFGAPYEKNGMFIIPVAISAGGGGVSASSLGKGDGGMGGLVVPSGAYVVKGDDVRWVPAVDVTIIALASLGVARILAGAWSRRRKRRGSTRVRVGAGETGSQRRPVRT